MKSKHRKNSRVHNFFIFSLTFLWAGGSEELNAAPPSWASSDATQLEGKILRTVCEGRGPSVDLARTDSLRSCRNSALNLLVKSGVTRTVVVETNNDVAFHQSSENEISYRDLACKPINESIEELIGGSYRVWIKCEFDLAASTSVQPSQTNKRPEEKDDSVKAAARLRAKNLPVAQEDRVSSERLAIQVMTIPPCDRIVITGQIPRTIPCATQPIHLSLSQTDEELSVFAKGYLPKSIKVKSIDRRNQGAIQVILESSN